MTRGRVKKVQVLLQRRACCAVRCACFASACVRCVFDACCRKRWLVLRCVAAHRSRCMKRAAAFIIVCRLLPPPALQADATFWSRQQTETAFRYFAMSLLMPMSSTSEANGCNCPLPLIYFHHFHAASSFFCFPSVDGLHCITLLGMAPLNLPVFWSSRKLTSLRGPGASALPPLTIFHSLSALQRWQNCTRIGHRPQQSRRCYIPAQHRRARMTRPPALPLPKIKALRVRVAAAVRQLPLWPPSQNKITQPKSQ